MKRRLGLLVVALVYFAPATAVATASPASSASRVIAAVSLKSCSGGYVRARLSWGKKCLRADQFCKVGNREYRKYGFVCPSSGHLRRR